MAALLFMATGCGQRDDGGPADGTTHGDAAVWMLAEQIKMQSMTPVPDEDITTSTTTFVAHVMRLGCSGGVTGGVLEPTVTWSEAQVVLTFEVEALPTNRDYTCPGNDAVPISVELGRPIGSRQLVDGACLPGQEAATTALCTYDSGVRWSPTQVAPTAPSERSQQGTNPSSTAARRSPVQATRRSA